MRSVSSSLRESKKLVNKLDRRLKFAVAENQKIQAEKQRIEAEKQTIENRSKLERRQHKMREQKIKKELFGTKRLLADAQRRLEKFRVESDWKEPEHVSLNRGDSRVGF